MWAMQKNEIFQFRIQKDGKGICLERQFHALEFLDTREVPKSLI